MYPPTVCRLNSQRAPLAPRIVEPPLCIGVSRKIVLACWLQEVAAGTAYKYYGISRVCTSRCLDF